MRCLLQSQGCFQAAPRVACDLPFAADVCCTQRNLMLMQTKNDVQSYIDKASALHLVWESAWTACDNASAAVRQARRALRMAPADQDLKKKLQLAMEVKAKAEEHQQHVDEQLRMERAERLDLIALLACTSKLSALLLYCWLADRLWASISVSAQ